MDSELNMAVIPKMIEFEGGPFLLQITGRANIYFGPFDFVLLSISGSLAPLYSISENVYEYLAYI